MATAIPLGSTGWDPGENYDIVFNGAAPTGGDFKTSPGPLCRRRQWLHQPGDGRFWNEMKTHPDIPYKPFGA